jgi:hypothetical protein
MTPRRTMRAVLIAGRDGQNVRVSVPTWDGVTRSASLNEWAVKARHELADCAKRGDWVGMFAVLDKHPQMVNASRPDGDSWYAPLHQAAYGGAPTDVVERLVGRGAWRLLRTAGGDLPVDIARTRGHAHLLGVLEPRRVLTVRAEELAAIQDRFHQVITHRVGRLVAEQRLRLPELAVLVELDRPEAWFAVPGMYGGFRYRLEPDTSEWRLVAESWVRTVGGSGQRHEITAQHARLVAHGFV